ncbi:unnamed protein product, partial [Cyprideis torosa]
MKITESKATPIVRVPWFQMNEVVHSTIFTPREYQVELLNCALDSDVILSLGNLRTKAFVAAGILRCYAHLTHPSVRSESRNRKWSLIVCPCQESASEYQWQIGRQCELLTHMLDPESLKNGEKCPEIDAAQVLIGTADSVLRALDAGVLSASVFTAVLIDQCHLAESMGSSLSSLVARFQSLNKRPRIVGITPSILNGTCHPSQMIGLRGLRLRNPGKEIHHRMMGHATHLSSATPFLTIERFSFSLLLQITEVVHRLENSLPGCRYEAASDASSVLRHVTDCREILLSCSPASEPLFPATLIAEVEEIIANTLNWLDDHVFNPAVIYGDEDWCLEFFKTVPSPKAEPVMYLKTFLEILLELGVWCADRLALQMLYEIEKLKRRTAHERHFLLYCATTTTLVHIRNLCQNEMKKFLPRDRLFLFATPKLLRLVELLGQYSLGQNRLNKSGNRHSMLKPQPESDVSRSDPNATFDLAKELDRVQQRVSEMETSNCSQSVGEMDSSLQPMGEMDNSPQPMGETDSSPQPMGETDSEDEGGACDREEDGEEKAEAVVDGVKTEESSKEGRRRGRGKWGRRREGGRGGQRNRNQGAERKDVRSLFSPEDPRSLSGVVFVEGRWKAKVVFHYLRELSHNVEEFYYLAPLYTASDGPTSGELRTDRDIELEHRRQEEILKRYRRHDCNLLILTSEVGEELDIPRANLVVRFDLPTSFSSYVSSKGRCRFVGPSHYVHFMKTAAVEEDSEVTQFVADLSRYHVTGEILEEHCAYLETPLDDLMAKSSFVDGLVEPLSLGEGIVVPLSKTVAVLNHFTAKIPSDTFTRLTPIWHLETKDNFYRCHVFVPFKPPMAGAFTKVKPLAFLLAAYKMLQLLSQDSSEMDREFRYSTRSLLSSLDSLRPSLGVPNGVGPHLENGHPEETPDKGTPAAAGRLENGIFPTWRDDNVGEILSDVTRVIMEGDGGGDAEDCNTPRPGTTKRRQYYPKRISEILSESVVKKSHQGKVYLNAIRMRLSCPIPDEHNIRGRRIHSPELFPQGFALLTTQPLPSVNSFPLFTRSGEIETTFEELDALEGFSEEETSQLTKFHEFTFRDVLRMEKYPMQFDPLVSGMGILIAPLKDGKNGQKPEINWPLIERILDKENTTVREKDLAEREKFIFRREDFEDSVVAPWYRNRDQPQFFYVAEICDSLTPQSTFPDGEYGTFENYYSSKYSIQIQNLKQPLLDVDLTSARLNLLTPRYINRKGVALPTCSAATKRIKRESLQQKVILVPELCYVHPFSASLWRKAVCLPSAVYRLNSLLLADELRRWVTVQMGLPQVISPAAWAPLDFGWKLRDIVQKKEETPEENETQEEQKVEPEIDQENNGWPEPETKFEDEVPEKDAEVPSTKEETLPVMDDFEIGVFDPSEATNIPPLPSPSKALEDIETQKKLNRSLNKELMGIGTWQQDNEADRAGFPDEEDFGFDMKMGLPLDLQVIQPKEDAEIKAILKGIKDGESSGSFRDEHGFRIGSPSNYGALWGDATFEPWYDSDVSDSDDEEPFDSSGMRLISENVAEAVEDEEPPQPTHRDSKNIHDNDASWTDDIPDSVELETLRKNLNVKIAKKVEDIKGGKLRYIQNIPESMPISLNFCPSISQSEESSGSTFNILDPEIQVEEASKEEEKNKVGNVVFDGLPLVSQPLVTCDRALPVGIAPWLKAESLFTFSFDEQPDLNNHPGPSPALILTALTMSNANDGINLERLETVGDSFLKFAITTWLFLEHPGLHEGKLSYIRSKLVSNHYLYFLGRKVELAYRMVAAKFEPHDNWLPPGYFLPSALEEAIVEYGIPMSHFNMAELPDVTKMKQEEIRDIVGLKNLQIHQGDSPTKTDAGQETKQLVVPNPPKFVPYNLLTQHSIPDKSIADSVEALIGAYLVSCGVQGALMFMSVVGITVFPQRQGISASSPFFRPPPSPMRQPEISSIPDPRTELDNLLCGYEQLEESIGYRFRDRSYLLQAFTHASYFPNRLTDCYQRLEFLGDAVLDYLITRHLYEDPRRHSPGELTDLRSALVNNTIFASLAVKHRLHNFFKHLSPGLWEVIDKFVERQMENGHAISRELYWIEEGDVEEVEDIEVPKALGDIFESLAGAIYLDSGLSLDTVWTVFYRIMKDQIETFSAHVPKSPIRELLEMEPETTKFGKPERLMDGRVRVSVEVFGKGVFKGIGRNYRIAKSTAAKCALRKIRLSRSGLTTASKSAKIFANECCHSSGRSRELKPEANAATATAVVAKGERGRLVK